MCVTDCKIVLLSSWGFLDTRDLMSSDVQTGFLQGSAGCILTVHIYRSSSPIKFLGVAIRNMRLLSSGFQVNLSALLSYCFFWP
jgi:hypothetical protein